MKSIYTEPKIVKYDDLNKPWFVFFRYNKKLFRYKEGINYYKSIKERTREAEALRGVLSDDLKAGWNPNIPRDSAVHQKMTLSEALDFALEKKKPNLSIATYRAYKCTVKFSKKAISDLKLKEMLLSEAKRSHIRIILEKIKEERAWSNKAYNKNLSYLQSVISELLQWELLEVNIAHHIKSLNVSESTYHTPATLQQHNIIKKELQANHPEFYLFISIIYHTGIRPKELLSLQLKMIDIRNKQIVLPVEIQKVKREDRIVPINSHLLKSLLSMDLYKYPSDYYLFGSFKKKGGRGVDFIPAPFRIRRDTATHRWNVIVKKGLGINITMYSTKHFGADQKILAGIDLDALRELYGHGSKLMTKKYAKVVKEVNRREIMEKSPDF